MQVALLNLINIEAYIKAMLMKSKSLVVDMNIQRRKLVGELLGNTGYEPIASWAQVSEMVACMATQNQATANLFLVLSQESFALDQPPALQGFLIENPMPVLLLTDDIDQKTKQRAMQTGVTAFLTLKVLCDDLSQAIDTAFASFDTVRDLKQKISSLENRLQDRIVVDKAKGLLMKSRGLDEAQAYGFLRKHAMRSGKKLIDVARMMIETSKLLDID